MTNQTSLVTELDTGTFQHTLSTGVKITREDMKTFRWTGAITVTSSLYNPSGTVRINLKAQ